MALPWQISMASTIIILMKRSNDTLYLYMLPDSWDIHWYEYLIMLHRGGTKGLLWILLVCLEGSAPG